MGSVTSIQKGNLTSKKYTIELNIRLLFVMDEKYFNEAFKIYWTRGSKKIDTRVATVKPDTQVAKFNDKFSMKTALMWDEEMQEFKDKPSTLQVFHLTREQETDDGAPMEELKLTGEEIDMGSVPFNLAQYARESFVTEKLYLNEMKDMYIEITVKSKPVDASSQATPREKQARPTSHRDLPSSGSSTTLL